MRQFTDWFNRPFEIDEGDIGQVGKYTHPKKKGKTNGIKLSKNFSDVLSDEERSLIVNSLHRVMTPFLLRRVKADVMLEVPSKVEKMVSDVILIIVLLSFNSLSSTLFPQVYCPLSKLQVKLHIELKSYVAEKVALNSVKMSNGELSKLIEQDSFTHGPRRYFQVIYNVSILLDKDPIVNTFTYSSHSESSLAALT